MENEFGYTELYHVDHVTLKVLRIAARLTNEDGWIITDSGIRGREYGWYETLGEACDAACVTPQTRRLLLANAQRAAEEAAAIAEEDRELAIYAEIGSEDGELEYAEDAFWFVFEENNGDETFLRAIMPRTIAHDEAIARISKMYAWIGELRADEQEAIKRACRIQGVANWKRLRLYGPNGMVEYGPWMPGCTPETYTAYQEANR